MEAEIKRKIYKSGNSHVVILPKFIMESLEVKKGDTIMVRFRNVPKK
jgi:antitoxin component of MazEF toxin-antitoxin module